MNKLECPFCERHCILDGDRIGFCQMYHLVEGLVAERFPHRYSSMFVSHIETVPFYHFQPGSRTFVLGGAGCNFDCSYCSNAYVARSDPEPLLYFELPPARVVELAQQEGCHNIAFAINEPTVALPTLFKLARVAAEANIPVGVLTNGYTPPDVAAQMGDAFAFVNVSIKSLDAAFYRDYVGAPAVEVIRRNVEILHDKTHLEISTPIVQGVNDHEIPDIAAFIASVDTRVAWHVFRLLPEYKMADYERPPIAAVNAALEAAREQLPYIYFGNFVGSQWVSTLCPQCGAVVIERINLGGCGAKSLAYHLKDNRCAACGWAIPITGEPMEWNSPLTPSPGVKPTRNDTPLQRRGNVFPLPFGERVRVRGNHLATIDVIDWQTVVDFRDGRPVNAPHELLDIAAQVIEKYPYPGDLSIEASHWVADVALDLNARYQPDFMLLDYADIFISEMFMSQDTTGRATHIRAVFDDIQRFVEESAFSPVIVGMGDLTPFQEYINVATCDGLISAGGMTARYAGLYSASARDLQELENHAGVARVIDRAAFREKFGGCAGFYERFPDHLLVAHEGYLFRGVGNSARPLQRIPAFNRQIPVHTPLTGAESITDIASVILDALLRQKVALILVEGVGCNSFPLPFSPIANNDHWYCYAVGEGQYLALTTGRRFVEHPYPSGYRYYVDDDEQKPYPFSGIYAEMPADTIGRRYAGKSAAVGSRGMLTHVVAGVDVTIECFVRALYNHGVMAVVDASR